MTHFLYLVSPVYIYALAIRLVAVKLSGTSPRIMRLFIVSRMNGNFSSSTQALLSVTFGMSS